MSKSHYIEIAAILKVHNVHAPSDDSRETVGKIARELALTFKRDNPRFNAGRFFDAAGFPELTNTRQGLN